MHSVAWWWKPRQPRPSKWPEPDLLLELLIVALDAPAQLGEIDQAIEGDVVWEASRANIWSARPRPSAIRSAAIPGHAAHDAVRRDARREHARAQSARPTARPSLRATRSCAKRAWQRLSASSLTETGRCFASRRSRVGRRPRPDHRFGGSGAVPGAHTVVFEQNAGHIGQPQRRDLAAQTRCCCHSPHPSAPRRAADRPRTPTASAQARSPAWSQSRSPPARPPCAGARGPPPTPAADTADRPPAGWHGDWPATATPPPGSCPACRAARNTAAPPRPSAAPSWESRCRR